MNVKILGKGICLNNNLCNPLTFNDDNLLFLLRFINWLKKWKLLGSDAGRLSKETHAALLITTNCIVELARYLFCKSWV